MFRTFLLLTISASALGFECQTKADKGASYRGSVSKTRSGKTCQAWDKQTPHKHSLSGDSLTSNFCSGEDGVWCYTMNSTKRWELCDVPMMETCPGDGSSSSDIVEKCEFLEVRHQALIVARIAHHCKDNPASGEATQCDKDVIMGLNDCGKNTMCILEIVSNSLNCNNTEVRCTTLDRLIYASSSSRALDCYTHMPDRRSGCPWYKKLGIEAAVLGAYAGCVAADIPDGETLLVPCILAVTEVLGATADCVCDIIPDKFKSVACDMPDRRDGCGCECSKTGCL